jgi:kynurenine formamidase
MYNGRRAGLVTTENGAKACAVTVAKDGIVTRGVLLDVARMKQRDWLDAGEAVFSQDLEEAERAQGVTVETGDALLLRLGWYRRRLTQGPPTTPSRPGLHAEALPWLRERGVSLLASDASHDVIPSGYDRLSLPMHQIGIVAMGLWLLDACNFEDLAQACAESNNWTFAFMVAPLQITGGTSSPVNPLAVL